MVQFRVLWQLVQGLLHSVSFLSRGIKQDVGSRWRSKRRVGVFLCLRLLSFSFSNPITPPFKLKHPNRVYPEFVGLQLHAWVPPFVPKARCCGRFWWWWFWSMVLPLWASCLELRLMWILIDGLLEKIMASAYWDFLKTFLRRFLAVLWTLIIYDLMLKK